MPKTCLYHKKRYYKPAEIKSVFDGNFITYELYLDNQKTLMNIHKSSYGEITKKYDQ